MARLWHALEWLLGRIVYPIQNYKRRKKAKPFIAKGHQEVAATYQGSRGIRRPW